MDKDLSCGNRLVFWAHEYCDLTKFLPRRKRTTLGVPTEFVSSAATHSIVNPPRNVPLQDSDSPSSKVRFAAPPSLVSPDQYTAATAQSPTPVTLPASRAVAATVRAQLAADTARANAEEVAVHTLHAACLLHGAAPAVDAAPAAATNLNQGLRQSASTADSDGSCRPPAKGSVGLRTPRGGRFVPAALPFHCAAEYWHGGGGDSGPRRPGSGAR